MAYYNLGVALQKLGEHQKAIDCYEKAIQINPNYAIAYNNLGNVLKELRQFQNDDTSRVVKDTKTSKCKFQFWNITTFDVRF